MRYFTPDSFAIEFVIGMRKGGQLRSEPTIRTAVSLTSLLAARRLRKGRLNGDDYIECAVLTTPPEDQDTAMKRALQVLSAPARLPIKSYTPSDESAAAAKVLAELELAKAIESSEMPKQAVEKIEDLLLDPNFAALIDETGGLEAAKARFGGVEELKKHIKDQVKQQLGGMSENSFALAVSAGQTDQVANNSPSKIEAAAASVLLGNSNTQRELKRIGPFDLKMKLLSFLSSAGVDIADDLQSLADQSVNLEQLARVSSMGAVHIDRKKMLKAISDAVPDQEFEKVFDLTEMLSSELADQARQTLYESYPDLNEQQLSTHAHLCAQWKSALEKAVAKRAEQAKGLPFDEAMSLIRDLFTVSKNQGDPVLAQHIHEGLQGAAEGALKTTQSLDELLDLINTADQMDTTISPALIREEGYRLGLSRKEMDQVLGSRLSLLKRMIEKGERVFERFALLIDKEKPNIENTAKLAEIAIKHENHPALAALGQYDLSWTLKGADQAGQGHELIIESLSAGPGTNLLMQWFSNREKVPENLKMPLRKLAKEVLVQYAVALGKQLIGDRSRGILEGEAVRSYVAGDDPSLIDMEETVQNMVSMGKPVSLLSADDLMVRQTTHGRRAVAMLIDISGSMRGEKMTWCAIAAAMLTYALRPDELALAFFESDTHVIKSFKDNMEIEQIADELLNLQSRGGTMLGRALDWVVKELRGVGSRRKNALILTDAAIFDLDHCPSPARLINSLHSSSTWFVPASDWATKEASALAKWSKGTVVRLGGNWRRFPALISEALK